jgi:hypothetical protein
VLLCKWNVRNDMMYLLTAIGLPPGGSSTVHIYTQTVHRTTQNEQYTEQHKHFGRVRTVPSLCELYLGICLTTEEKARKTLSQGSRREPAGTMKIHNHTIRIQIVLSYPEPLQSNFHHSFAVPKVIRQFCRRARMCRDARICNT